MILAVCEGMTSWVQACQDKVCIPGKIASLITTAYNAVLIAVPLLLIISGMITLAVSITKQKEDDIKKAQQLLVKKLIAGAIVFLLLGLVKWMISYFDGSLVNCFDALINYNKDSDNCYYDKNGVLQGGAECKGPSSLEFGTADYQCQAAGADGAILLDDADNSIICYTKDTKCCKCTGTVSGTPFWGRLKNEKDYQCYCAVERTLSDGTKVKRATDDADETGDCN